jgi:hypothetical protein
MYCQGARTRCAIPVLVLQDGDSAKGAAVGTLPRPVSKWMARSSAKDVANVHYGGHGVGPAPLLRRRSPTAAQHAAHRAARRLPSPCSTALPPPRRSTAPRAPAPPAARRLVPQAAAATGVVATQRGRGPARTRRCGREPRRRPASRGWILRVTSADSLKIEHHGPWPVPTPAARASRPMPMTAARASWPTPAATARLERPPPKNHGLRPRPELGQSPEHHGLCEGGRCGRGEDE